MLDIDLLYTHVWDYGTPLEETLETLQWLVQQGKVNKPKVLFFVCALNITYNNSQRKGKAMKVLAQVEVQVRYVGGSNMTGSS